MQQRLEVGGPDIIAVRVSLEQNLRQLEAERDRINGSIEEVQRRIRIVEEVLSWAAPEIQQRRVDQDVHPLNGDARLVIMPLAAAIVHLRQETPEITKRQVRERLEAIGYQFGESAVGRAIHTAWIAADRRLRAENP